jgi:8-oxo-dGTP pyrophosphatase MutT (NUDIX family)
MFRGERTDQGSSTSTSLKRVLSEGSWNENISWRFILSGELPDVNLCTAVCCIATYQQKIILVRNKRGWELPAGKMETAETVELAVAREVKEETCAVISNPHFIGYKELTALKPVPHAENTDDYYPFPISYVVYYYADVLKFSDHSPAKDILEVKLANYTEAQTLLASQGQYRNILEYLMQGKLIDLV